MADVDIGVHRAKCPNDPHGGPCQNHCRRSDTVYLDVEHNSFLHKTLHQNICLSATLF